MQPLRQPLSLVSAHQVHPGQATRSLTATIHTFRQLRVSNETSRLHRTQSQVLAMLWSTLIQRSIQSKLENDVQNRQILHDLNDAFIRDAFKMTSGFQKILKSEWTETIFTKQKIASGVTDTKNLMWESQSESSVWTLETVTESF